MKDVVIVGAVRTPIGCFQGALARHSAVELGSLVIHALVERSGISAAVIDEVIIGQVLTAGTGKTRRASRLSKAVCQIPFRPLPLTTSAVPV